MTNTFADIIYELGKNIDLDLSLDTKNTCTLLIDEKLSVQIEFDKATDNLLLAAFISPLPPGKFREKVLLSALKTNFSSPLCPILSYNERNNQLALFEYLSLDKTDGKNLYNKLAEFIDIAIRWQKAIESGRSFPEEKKSSSSSF